MKLPAMSLQPSIGFVLDDQAKMTKARNYFAWQSQMVMKDLGQRVIEVGCGIGNFTGMLLDREIVIAVDIEAQCIERLQMRYPGRTNLRVYCGDAAGSAFGELARFRPDSFVCLNVLEHIAEDRRALSTMASMLCPGGVIVLLVPAFEALYGPLDYNLGHYRRYTRKSMVEMAESVGLTVKRARYINTVGFFGWWANSKIFRRESQSPKQIAFFDRFVVPIMSRIEGGISPPFGQSLFAVLQKPGA